MVTADQLLVRISYHAVARYVQRIMRVELPADLFARSGREQADEACRIAGTSIDEVRREILNPALAAAMLGGFSQMSCTLFTAKLMKAPGAGVSVVASIQEPRAEQKRRAIKGPLKFRDRSEQRREAHKHKRRRKGLP